MAEVQLYRSSHLCDALMDTMDELMSEGKMSEDLGHRVLANFDQSMLAALSKRADGKAHLLGKLATYNHLESVWQMVATDVDFKLVPRAQGSLAKAPKLHADKVKLYLVDGKIVQT